MGRHSIAVTVGDPRGIGPEVTAAAAATFLDESPHTDLVWVVPANLPGLDLPGGRTVEVEPFTGTEPDAGRVSVECIQRSVELARAGHVGAILTGPVHKPALHAAGFPTPGQTEMLKELAGADEVAMLMCAERTRLDGPLRVVLATTHIPLRDVVQRIDADLLVRQATLLRDALRSDWGIAEPRVALCALNPHASDRGLFGDEEERIYGPALVRLTSEGIAVDGPLPADTVFSRALEGRYDGVVAPYHDVGMAAFKTVSFGTGVNVTLGLPFIRTSPDHGTAFDIAGQGLADPTSTLEALRLAARLARRRFDTPLGDA